MNSYCLLRKTTIEPRGIQSGLHIEEFLSDSVWRSTFILVTIVQFDRFTG